MQLLSALFTLGAIVSSTLATPIDIISRDNIHPPKDQVHIESIKYAGSGCPAGSVAVSMAEDLSNVAILFSDYIAQIGPTIQPKQWRKNCILNFKISFPSGFTYTIFETEYHGYVSLDPKVTGRQQSDYWFTGYGKKISWFSEWTGPFANTYNFRDDIHAKSEVWAPCGKKTTLNVNTMIQLENRRNATGSGLMTNDMTSLTVNQLYHTKWNKCH